ncbi:MAG: helix-turn-helix domain-containing protein [Sphingobacteriaceae bacterium]|nr:helix-turn-helix domain-containing protein [Cytophagaceae bacterium]
MQIQLHEIAPVLRPFVKVICSLEQMPGEPSAPVRVLPDTSVELFVNFREPEKLFPPQASTPAPGRSFITSRMNQFMDVETLGSGGFLTVCFHPGQAYPFFPVPMDEVTNQITDLRELWGRVVAELEEQVEQAGDPSQRVAVVQRYLIARLRAQDKLDQTIGFCLAQLNRPEDPLSVEELAGKAGISNRQLLRRFNQCVGLSPKELARIQQFLHALNGLKGRPAASLTEIAYESGYYDQAHFIHACRAYAGLSPRQLRSATHVLY